MSEIDQRDASPLRATMRPLFDYVLVKEIENEKVRKSGIQLPDTVRDLDAPPHHAIVIAAGPGLDWWNGAGVEMPVAAGDHVVFPRSAGTYVEIDEERLLALRVGQIIGVVDNA